MQSVASPSERLALARRRRVGASLILLVDGVLLFAAIFLAFEIEGTSQAVRDSAHGGAVAALAIPSLIAALLTWIGGHRRWAGDALILSVLNAVLAAGVLVLI